MHHNLIEALKFYANGDHLLLADPDAWDTCSGEPINFLHDDAGTASVEDGSIAKAALDSLNSSPVSAGEYGDAYQGAREDLAIWKRRALEAESKIREQDQIIDNLGNALNGENGPTFMGEPVIRAGGVDERE